MAPAEQVLTFEVAGKAFSIPAAMVNEIVPTPRMTRVPQAPASLKGLANLRGRVTPIVSLAAIMGADHDRPAPRVIVLDRRDPLGFTVDRVISMGAREAAGDAKPAAEVLAPASPIDLEALLATAFTAPLSSSSAERATPSPAREAAEPNSELAFLQFDLAGQAYALPLDQVREVVAVPSDLTVLPGRDVVMLGVAPLRDELLGLVSLAPLLGLPVSAVTPQSRLVVAVLGETTVGLLVDRVRSVLRAAADALGVVPAILNRGAGEAQVDAILRSPRGLVSVLSADRIFQDSTVAEVAARSAGRTQEIAGLNEGAAQMEQFVIFRLGAESYGLPVGSVSEVVRVPAAVTRAPRAPAFVAGVMNHRGLVVPLIDQRMRFEASGTVDARTRRVIISRLDDLVAGFIVDAVEQILSIPADALRSAPALVSAETPIFDRIATFEHEGRLILLMDPRQLLDQTERQIVEGLAAQAEFAPA